MPAYNPCNTLPQPLNSLLRTLEPPCYANPSKIESWLSGIRTSPGESEEPPPDGTCELGTSNHAAIQQPPKCATQQRAMESEGQRNERVTRSRRRQQQQNVDQAVASLTLDDAEQNAEGAEKDHKEGTSPLVLPRTTSAHQWISADTQSGNSGSAPPLTQSETIPATTTFTSSPSKRSKSPVKSMVDLGLLDRKIKRAHPRGKEFPDTIRPLVRNLENVRRAKGIIPHEIRSEFEERVEGEDWWWNRAPSTLQSKGKTASKTSLLFELEIMEEIEDNTRRLQDSDAAEARWNDEVHFMMLRQACKHLSGIEQQNITSARPNPLLVPTTRFGETESKLVDFALVCDEELIPVDLVDHILGHQSNGIDSINHTSASVQGLRQNPIVVSIETKTPNGNESTALTQLSLWAATHFNRLRTLLPNTKRDVVLMPLPLIMAIGGRYSLFFAIDGPLSEGIRIAGGETTFGDCATLDGCYQVLTGLVLVGIWVKEVWVPWFIKECLEPNVE